MKTVDFSGMIVMYNFVVGVLIMLSSEKVASLAGNVINPYRNRVVRLTRISTFTFGAVVAGLSGFIYLAFHMLKIEF